MGLLFHFRVLGVLTVPFGLTVEIPYIYCAGENQHQSEASETTAYDDEDCAFGEGRGLQVGISVELGDDDLVGGDTRSVLSELGKGRGEVWKWGRGRDLREVDR